MQYLFLAYAGETQTEGLSTSERTTFEKACRAVEQELQQSGYLLSALHPSSPLTTVKVLDGALSLSEGFSIEAQGKLIAIFLINARDLNEAVRVAAKMPQALRGYIEVMLVTILYCSERLE